MDFTFLKYYSYYYYSDSDSNSYLLLLLLCDLRRFSRSSFQAPERRRAQLCEGPGWIPAGENT